MNLLVKCRDVACIGAAGLAAFWMAMDFVDFNARADAQTAALQQIAASDAIIAANSHQPVSIALSRETADTINDALTQLKKKEH